MQSSILQPSVDAGSMLIFYQSISKNKDHLYMNIYSERSLHLSTEWYNPRRSLPVLIARKKRNRLQRQRCRKSKSRPLPFVLVAHRNEKSNLRQRTSSELNPTDSDVMFGRKKLLAWRRRRPLGLTKRTSWPLATTMVAFGYGATRPPR